MVIYPDEPEKLTAGDAGAIFDGARGRHMPSAILDYAQEFGYNLSESILEYLKEENRKDPDAETDELIDDYEWVNEEVDRAENWMNDRVAPRGYYFGAHPDYGDWGLYSVLMGSMGYTDLPGTRTVALSDLLDYVREEGSKVTFLYHDYNTHNILKVKPEDVNRGFDLPEFVDIGAVEHQGDSYKPTSITIEIKDADQKDWLDETDPGTRGAVFVGRRQQVKYPTVIDSKWIPEAQRFYNEFTRRGYRAGTKASSIPYKDLDILLLGFDDISVGRLSDNVVSRFKTTDKDFLLENFGPDIRVIGFDEWELSPGHDGLIVVMDDMHGTRRRPVRKGYEEKYLGPTKPSWVGRQFPLKVDIGKSQPATIVAATQWSHGGGGEYPARYVVLEWPAGTSAHPYSRHMQVDDGIHENYFIYGHYKMTYQDALHDLKESLARDKLDYPPTNPSYISGMDFER